MTEVGCLAHARRKFFDLWANHKSPVAEEALRFYEAINDIERTAQALDVDQRTRLRTLNTRPILDTFHAWLVLQRQKSTDGTAIAKAIDYSLKRWEPLVRFVADGSLPPGNNHIENRIRPIALGRSNWLFGGSKSCCRIGGFQRQTTIEKPNTRQDGFAGRLPSYSSYTFLYLTNVEKKSETQVAFQNVPRAALHKCRSFP